jgi:DNA adenine methylase
MGSKRKILPFVRDVVTTIPCDTVLDAFSGSGVVSYLLKLMGKTVTSNDFLAYCYRVADALVANEGVTLACADIEWLLRPVDGAPSFVQDTFRGMYYTEEENGFIDRVSANIWQMADETKRSLALAALARACLKKVPRGVFTVFGDRYNDGRRDLRVALATHFLEAIELGNRAVFGSGRQHRAVVGDIFDLSDTDFDLVYFDPPYVTKHSDNDYVRRYHFIEGLSTYWNGVSIMAGSRTKRLENRPSPFGSRSKIHEAFRMLFRKFGASTLLVSYSSNSIPSKGEMIGLMEEAGKRVEIHAYDHKYSFGTHAHKVGDNRNAVQEYLFVGR